MRHLRLSLNLIVLLIPLVVLGIGAALFVNRIYTYLNTNARLAGVVTNEATRLLGRPVVVRDVKITGNIWGLSATNRVVLSDVSIAQSAADPSPLLSADKITFRYNLNQVALNTNPQVPYVDSVDIAGARAALIRDRQGRWNIAELLEGRAKPTRPLVDTFTFSESFLLFRDEAFPLPEGVPYRPFEARLASLAGVALIRPDNSVTFTVSGRERQGHWQKFQATGALALDPVRINARLLAQQVQLPFVASYVLPPKQGRIPSGVADLDVSGVYLPGPEVEFPELDLSALTGHGTARFVQVSADIPELDAPIRGMEGTLNFTQDALAADVKGQVAGTRIVANGRVVGLETLLTEAVRGRNQPRPAATPQPTFTLRGELPNVEIARLVRELNLPRRLEGLNAEALRQLRQARGSGHVTFSASGALNDPTAAVSAQFATVQTGDYRMQSVDLNALYAHQTVTADVRARYANGELAVRAQAALDGDRAYQAQARGRNVDLGAVGIALDRKVSGTADLDLTAQGRQGRLPRLTGQVQLRGLNIDKAEFDSMYARVETEGDTLLLRSLRVQDEKGIALAQGRVNLKTRALDVRVAADELDLARLAQALDTRPADGTAQVAGAVYLRGRLTGTTDVPHFDGTLTGFGLQAGRIDADTLVAQVDFSRDALRIEQATLSRYPAEIVVSGVIENPLTERLAINRDAALDLTARISDLYIPEALKVAEVDTQGLIITGTLFADAQVSGTLRSPVVTSDDVRLADASINDLLIENPVVRMQYADDTLRVAQLRAGIAGGAVEISGTVARGGTLALNIGATGIDLETLAALAPSAETALLQGEASLQASVTGTLQDPSATLSFSTQGLKFNTIALGELSGAATYRDKVIIAESVRLGDPMSPQGRILLSDLRYNAETEELSGRGEIQDFTIQKLREIVLNSSFVQSERGRPILNALNRITGPIQGQVSGEISLSGTANTPVARISWNADNILINGHSVSVLTGSARVDQEKIVVPAQPGGKIIHLESPEAFVDVRGSIAYSGQIDGEIRADQLNLAFLRDWFEEDIAARLGGAGDIYVVASGTTEAPVLDVSVNLYNVTYRDDGGNVRKVVDRAEVAHATIREGLLEATSVTLTYADPQSDQTYRGALRGSVGFSWTPPFIPPDAALDLRADLPKQSLALVNVLSPGLLADSIGEISLTARATGTRTDPEVTGALTLEAPKLRLGSLGSFQPTPLSTGLRGVDAVFRFTGSRLEVERFTAQSQIYDNKTGNPIPGQTGDAIRLTGSIPLVPPENPPAQPAELLLRSERALFAEAPLPGATSGGARGVADVALRLQNSLLEPTLAGVITVRDSQATLPNTFGGLESGNDNLPLYPRFNVRVRLADNVRLINPQLNASTAGDILLTGNPRDPRLQGTLALTGGRLTLPTTRFTILTNPPGTIRILYPTFTAESLGQPTLGITVNMRAQTYLTARSLGGVRKRYRVIVNARGPISGMTTDPITGESRLQLTFQTDPPDLASNQQELTRRIAGALGGIDALNQLGTNPEQAIASQLTSVFAGSILPGLFDRPAEALGFEELSVSYDPIQQLTLTVSRNLFGPLYVTYTRTLSGTQELYEFKASLRFKNRYQLSFTTNERQVQQVLLEGVWQY